MFTFLIIAEVLFIILLLAFLFFVLLNKKETKEGIRFQYLNEKYRNLTHELNKLIISKEKGSKEAKLFGKKRPKFEKPKTDSRTYLLKFKGNSFASEVSKLREEITAILTVATKKDEIVISIESPGGTVNGYGLAASQLNRIKDAGIKLTVLVDKVAASGGYMMACVGDKIIASPFAYVGSIGVVAEFPNYNKLLKKFNIDYKTYTAGESKRTVTQFGKITPDGERRFKERMTSIHTLFKTFVKTNRPKADIKKIATGDHWTASEALELGLVDKIQSSDDYILEKVKESHVYSVISYQKAEFMQKFITMTLNSLDTKLEEVYNRHRLEI